MAPATVASTITCAFTHWRAVERGARHVIDGLVRRFAHTCVEQMTTARRQQEIELELFAPHAQVAIAAPQSSTDVSSWAVATKRGTQSGVGVSVSGAGAWARLDGDMT